jgi:hypothetical protein
MVHHTSIDIQNLKMQAQMKRAQNATLANPFNWINSFEINSKNIPSLMDLKLQPPFKLIRYSVPPKTINFQKQQQLSILDPRNKIYYQKQNTSSIKFNTIIPLESTTNSTTDFIRQDNSNTMEYDILELHAPDFDPYL